jgi:hypothetical protein
VKPPVADSALVVALLPQVPVLTDRIVAEAESYRKAAAVSPEDLRLGQPGEVLAARSCRDNLVEMLARWEAVPQGPEAPLATGRAEQGFRLAEVLYASKARHSRSLRAAR